MAIMMPISLGEYVGFCCVLNLEGSVLSNKHENRGDSFKMLIWQKEPMKKTQKGRDHGVIS
jgi:hypothetical protein